LGFAGEATLASNGVVENAVYDASRTRAGCVVVESDRRPSA
jgi:hypothetical protein